MAKKTAKKAEANPIDGERREHVTQLAQRMFGRDPRRVAFPGGRSRAAFLADMGENGEAPQPWVFARRADKGDAGMEGIVLKALQGSGHTPRVKGVWRDWVVQEALPGVRLPLALDDEPDETARIAMVERALEGLANIHATAQRTGLHHRVPKVGTVDKWLWDRTGAAKRISLDAGIHAPQIDREWLVERMDVRRTHFVKWDARPGNAMLHGDTVSWFDWEDCGRSVPLDDLAFVLFDEWTPLSNEATAALVARHTDTFNPTLGREEGALYLRLFAMTHTVLRLRMALKLRNRDDEWWDREYCLEGDKVGVTATETARLIRRGRWLADEVTQLAPYGPWLAAIAERYGIAG